MVKKYVRREEWMEYFLILSAACGGIIAVTSGLTAIFHNKIERKWRYILWIALAVRMLIPVDLSLPEPVVKLELWKPEGIKNQTPVQKPSQSGDFFSHQQPVQETGSTQNRQTPSSGTQMPTDKTSYSTEPALPEEKTWDDSMIWSLLPWIWVTGALLSLLWFGGSYAYHRGELLRWSYIPKGKRLTEYFENSRQELGIRQVVKLRVCKKIGSPMMLGILRPVLLMPEGSYTAKDLEYIFRHELLHVKRHDVWMKSLMLAVRIVHWFNPLTIVMSRGMSEDIEILCDAQVVRNMDEGRRREYSEVLLKYLAQKGEGRMEFSTCFGSRIKKIKDRLLQVSRGGKLRKGYILCGAMLGAVLMGSLLASCGRDKEPEPSRVDSSQLEEESKPDKTKPDESKPQDSSMDSSSIQDSSTEESKQETIISEQPSKEEIDAKPSKDTPMAQAFVEIVDRIWEEYGEPEMIRVFEQAYQQNGVVRLLDFDGDGTPELYCSYEHEKGIPIEHVIYQYRDGKANLIWKERVTSKGTDVSPASYFLRKDGKVYLNWAEEAIGAMPRIWSYQDGQWTTFLEYDNGFFRYDGMAVFNGKLMTQNQMRSAANKALVGFERYIILYYYVTEPEELTLTQQTVAALKSCAEGAELVLPDDSRFWKPVQPLNMVYEPVQTEKVKIAQQYLTAMYEIESQNQSLIYEDRDGGILTGVFRLIDFDGDGSAELYCAYNTEKLSGYPDEYPNWQEIYQYQEGQTVKVFESPITNRYDHFSPVTWLIETGGKVYLKNSEFPAEQKGEYLELRNGRMQPVFQYEFGDGNYRLNGESVSRDALYEAMNSFEDGGREQIISYDNSDRNAEKITYNTRFMLEDTVKRGDEYKVPDDSEFWTDCKPHFFQDESEITLPPPDEQYRQIIAALQEKYGDGYKASDGELKGLFQVRLIDFDGDGTNELYCAYSVPVDSYFVQDEEIYQIQNRKAVRVHRGRVYHGEQYQPQTTCLERDGKVYLKQEGTYSMSSLFGYKTIIDGKMQWVYHCQYDSYYIRGTEVTEQEYIDSIQKFVEGGSKWTYFCSGKDSYPYMDPSLAIDFEH